MKFRDEERIVQIHLVLLLYGCSYFLIIEISEANAQISLEISLRIGRLGSFKKLSPTFCKSGHTGPYIISNPRKNAYYFFKNIFESCTPYLFNPFTGTKNPRNI